MNHSVSSDKKTSFVARVRDDAKLTTSAPTSRRRDSFVKQIKAAHLMCESGKENSNTHQANQVTETPKDTHRVFVPLDTTSVS